MIIDWIVVLGHGLHMSVTAEGVETEEQLALLRSLRCDQIQGFLLGRPVPPGELAYVRETEWVCDG